MGTIQIVTMGSPITDLALDMLRSIQQEDGKSHISYFSRNRSGEPLRSTTIVIYGENPPGHWPAVYQLLSEHPPL